MNCFRRIWGEEGREEGGVLDSEKKRLVVGKEDKGEGVRVMTWTNLIGLKVCLAGETDFLLLSLLQRIRDFVCSP